MHAHTHLSHKYIYTFIHKYNAYIYIYIYVYTYMCIRIAEKAAHTDCNEVARAVFHAPMFALNAVANWNACEPSHARSTPTERARMCRRGCVGALSHTHKRARARTQHVCSCIYIRIYTTYINPVFRARSYTYTRAHERMRMPTHRRAHGHTRRRIHTRARARASAPPPRTTARAASTTRRARSPCGGAPPEPERRRIHWTTRRHKRYSTRRCSR
jgi:hypothetical protein